MNEKNVNCVAFLLVFTITTMFFSLRQFQSSSFILRNVIVESGVVDDKDTMPEATTTKSILPVIDFQRTGLTSQEFENIFRTFQSTKGQAPNSIMYNVKNIFKKVVITNEHRNKFIIKPNLDQCRINPNHSKKLTLLGLVMIGADYFERRQLIRDTWANKQLMNDETDFRVIFCIGLSKNTTSNELIKQEAKKYNDILQEDFTDNYFNLTIKVIGAYKFAHEYCANNVEYVLRVNDDVVVNIKYLVKFLKNLSVQGANTGGVRNAIMGNIHPHSRPDRGPKSKWYVSESEYEGNRYFPYMEGSIHVMTFDLASEIYQLSRFVYWPPFSVSLEDVYIGLLCMHLQTNYIQMLPHFLNGDQWGARLDSLKLSPNKQNIYFIFAHELNDYKAKWDALKEIY